MKKSHQPSVFGIKSGEYGEFKVSSGLPQYTHPNTDYQNLYNIAIAAWKSISERDPNVPQMCGNTLLRIDNIKFNGSGNLTIANWLDIETIIEQMDHLGYGKLDKSDWKKNLRDIDRGTEFILCIVFAWPDEIGNVKIKLFHGTFPKGNIKRTFHVNERM